MHARAHTHQEACALVHGFIPDAEPMAALEPPSPIVSSGTLSETYSPYSQNAEALNVDRVKSLKRK